MKKFLLATLCFASVFAFAATAESDSEKRKRIAETLYGRIKIVSQFPDFRVRKVENLEDLRVTVVSELPTLPGRWQIVSDCEDYRVQFVDGLDDVRVMFVGDCPEIP